MATSVQLFVNMLQNWVFFIFSFLRKYVNKKILKLSVLQTRKITMKKTYQTHLNHVNERQRGRHLYPCKRLIKARLKIFKNTKQPAYLHGAIIVCSLPIKVNWRCDLPYFVPIMEKWSALSRPYMAWRSELPYLVPIWPVPVARVQNKRTLFHTNYTT